MLAICSRLLAVDQEGIEPLSASLILSISRLHTLSVATEL